MSSCVRNSQFRVEVSYTVQCHVERILYAMILLLVHVVGRDEPVITFDKFVSVNQEALLESVCCVFPWPEIGKEREYLGPEFYVVVHYNLLKFCEGMENGNTFDPRRPRQHYCGLLSFLAEPKHLQQAASNAIQMNDTLWV